MSVAVPFHFTMTSAALSPARLWHTQIAASIDSLMPWRGDSSPSQPVSRGQSAALSASLGQPQYPGSLRRRRIRGRSVDLEKPRPHITVVGNTSPIINLTAVEQLPLLQQLNGRITIPRAVNREILVNGTGEPGSREVQQLDCGLGSTWLRGQCGKVRDIARCDRIELQGQLSGRRVWLGSV